MQECQPKPNRYRFNFISRQPARRLEVITMSKTTIQLSQETKAQLDQHRIADRESYDSILSRLAQEHDPDEIDMETIREVAREEISEQVVMEAQK